MASQKSTKKLDGLPDEILLRVISFLQPRDFPNLQLVSQALQKLSLDNNHWRSRCFNQSPFLESITRKRRDLTRYVEEDENLDGGLVGAEESLSREYGSLSDPFAPHLNPEESREFRKKQRVKDMTNWDPSFPSEPVFWYNEYIQRYAQISTSWLQQPRIRDEPEGEVLDVRGVGLYSPNEPDDGSTRESLLAVSPLDDGSICLWDVKGTRGRKGALLAKSSPGILYIGGPGSDTTQRSRKMATGVTECISVNSQGNRAYVAVQGHLLEVDLQRLDVVSDQSFEWSITALSTAQPGVPLTVGTSLGLHLHDYRARVRTNIFDPEPLPPYAPLSQPTPLSILHLPCPRDQYSISEDIYVAGRFSNILHYDRRKFPSIMGSIHSGARLSSLASLPYPFSTVDAELRRNSELSADQVWDSKNREGGRTLIACGEYGTKGSLELYGLSPRAADSRTGGLLQNSTMKNRQTSAGSKILSVVNHGTRIVFSDSSGDLKWFERDGITEVRRHKIGQSEMSARPSLFSTMPGSEDLARKILSTQTRHSMDRVNSDDILFWTGEKLGLVGFSAKPEFRAEDFEARGLKTDEEEQADFDEREYSDRMRRALERQADDVRFVANLGFGVR